MQKTTTIPENISAAIEIIAEVIRRKRERKLDITPNPRLCIKDTTITLTGGYNDEKQSDNPAACRNRTHGCP